MQMKAQDQVVKPKMNSGFRFFKCISTSHKHIMVIPAAVTCEMPRLSRVVLRDRYGNIWTVGLVVNCDGELSFQEGWPHFYEENCLEPLDFIFFEYKGGPSNVFDFKILGQNACQKKGVPKLRTEEEYGAFSDSNDDDSDYSVEDSNEEEEEEEEEVKSDVVTTNRPFFVSTLRSRKTELFIPKEVIVDYKLKLPKKLFLVDVGGNKWKTAVKQWKDGRVCCTGGGWRRLCNANNINKDDKFICEFILKECQDPCILVRVATLEGTRRNATTPRKDDIFRQGLATRLKNRQFFVSTSRPRIHELGIPKRVIKDYKLELPDALFLVDESGNRWETKVKKQGDGRVACSGGWRSLCNVNNIHKNDACFCEFHLECDDPYILVRVDAHY